MEERYIVAIDLGTATLAISVARVENGSMKVVYYKEYEAEGMEKSSVFNQSSVSRVLIQAKSEAEEALGITITHAAVNMPRYAISEITSQSEMNRDPDTPIGNEDIQALMTNAKSSCELNDPEMDVVYDAVAQSYSDGEDFQIREEDILGLEREHIEGNFKIFVGKKTGLRRIDTVFDKAGIIPVKFFTADTTARAVLNKAAMETGVALVEIGAGVTSVSIYIDNVMRYYSSIPFGGKIITADIKQECGISEKLAENIKKGYGICIPNRLQNLGEKTLQIRSLSGGNDKQISVKYLSEIVTARMTEIVDAVLYKIQESQLADDLRSGIIITGGGANLTNCANLFLEMSGYTTKLGYPLTRFSTVGECEGIHETSAATSIGMLMAAWNASTLNYAGEPAEAPVKAAVVEPEPEVEEEPNQSLEDIWKVEEDERKAAERKRKAEEKEKERERKEAAKNKKKEEPKTPKTNNIRESIGGFISNLFSEEDA